MLKHMFAIVESSMKVGVTTIDIDNCISYYMKLNSLESSPIKYYNYASCTCTTTDKFVTHGVASDYKIHDSTVLKMDISFYSKLNDQNYDCTRVFVMEDVDIDTINMISFAKFAIDKSIQLVNKQIKKTKFLNLIDLGKYYEHIVQKYSNYQICTTFGGHKIGKKLHEAPFIPGYDITKSKNIELLEYMKKNMNIFIAKPQDIFCFEPIISINNGTNETTFSVDAHNTLHTHDNCYIENMYYFDGEKIVNMT